MRCLVARRSIVVSGGAEEEKILGSLSSKDYSSVDLDFVFKNLKDRMLGSGAYKRVFAIKGDPAHALMVAGPADPTGNYLIEQKNTLDYLSDLGIPCIKIEKVEKISDGHAGICRRLHGSNRGGALKGIHELWSEKTVSSLAHILAAMRAARVTFGDFQVLIEEDGSLVVNDPHNNLSVLDRLLEIEDLPPRVDCLSSVVNQVAQAWVHKMGGDEVERRREIYKMAKEKVI